MLLLAQGGPRGDRWSVQPREPFDPAGSIELVEMALRTEHEPSWGQVGVGAGSHGTQDSGMSCDRRATDRAPEPSNIV